MDHIKPVWLQDVLEHSTTILMWIVRCLFIYASKTSKATSSMLFQIYSQATIVYTDWSIKNTNLPTHRLTAAE